MDGLDVDEHFTTIVVADISKEVCQTFRRRHP
jgi:hypothetical protein